MARTKREAAAKAEPRKFHEALTVEGDVIAQFPTEEQLNEFLLLASRKFLVEHGRVLGQPKMIRDEVWEGSYR